MPSQQSKFRQVEEKNILTEVEMMEWSPKMDLIALANVQGEVVMQRLSWKKVWTLPSRGENIKVQTLSWRPDGKILAIGYNNSTVLLCDVENSEILHTLQFNAPISATRWVSAADKVHGNNTANVNSFFQDNSAQFLPKLPCLSKSYGSSLSKMPEESTDDSKKLSDQRHLNVLAVGTETGRLYMFIYGIFPVGDISPTDMFNDVTVLKAMKQQTPSPSPEDRSRLRIGKIINATLSDSLNHMTVTLETSCDNWNTDIHTFSFRTPLLASRQQELQVLALKYGQILSLISYLSTTIHSITEAWEDILLEIDSKLTTYAEEKFNHGSGTVSDDFLELLMFGTPSAELETFLMNHLTEKGLKKLGHSIELSYSNIQKLVLKHLQSVGQAIVYHLSDVAGMSLWFDKFGMLGLSPESVSRAVRSAGSFMLKSTEIQQVIDNSMRNFKAFFRWLYAIILRLSDEPIPPEINKVTQQDLNFVTEFLTENFTEEWNAEKKHIFNLEKVGQYLKNEELPFPPETSHNPWVKFLSSERGSVLSNSPLLFPHYPKKSLIQQCLELQECVNQALEGPAKVMGQALQLSCVLHVHRGPSYVHAVAQTYSTSGHFLYTVMSLQDLPCNNIMLLEQEVGLPSAGTSSVTRGIRLKFDALGGVAETLKESREASSSMLMSGSIGLDGPNESARTDFVGYRILGVQFYTKEVLSVLLVEDPVTSMGQDYSPGPAMIAQLTLRSVVDRMQVVEMVNEPLTSVLQSWPVVNASPLIDASSYRSLENMKPSCFAVSGSRNVACVLFASRRRVRLFEVDADDEENEENDESTMMTTDAEDSMIGKKNRCQSEARHDVTEGEHHGVEKKEGMDTDKEIRRKKEDLSGN